MSYTLLIAFIILGHSQLALFRKFGANDSELETLSERLLKKSKPNLLLHVNVNLQSRTSSHSSFDDAKSPSFCRLLSINETIVYKVPTIEKMRALFDNYEMDVSQKETITPQELSEDKDFINAVLDTPVMQTAMNFLQNKGLAKADRNSQFGLLKKIWFDMYPRTRGGSVGSSGFEHVFLNELRHGKPMGMHNWLYFYHKENRTGSVHDVDYMGYMNNLYMGNQGQIIKFRMSFKGVTKPVNSLFIGTLPEFEMALYTVCFMVNRKRCPVSANGKKFKIVTFPFHYNGKRMVASAFPVI